jgi:hypothetical protein
MAEHADYLAAHEEHRWAKPLAELAEALRHEAYEKKGEWAWRILPGGALVAMRVPPTFQKEIRIARRDPLKTEESLKKWLDEVRVFQKHLGAERWGFTEIVARPGEPGPIHVILREPAPLGTKGDETKCARCGKPTPHQPQFKEDLCNSCALEIGTEEAQHRRGG